MVSHLSLPGGGLGGKYLWCCCFILFRRCLAASGTQDISKGAVSQSLGLKRRTVVNCESRDRFPPPLSPAGSSGLPKSNPPAHSWNQVRAVTLESPLQVVIRQAVTSLKPGYCVPPRCPSVGTLVVPLVPLARSLGAR